MHYFKFFVGRRYLGANDHNLTAAENLICRYVLTGIWQHVFNLYIPVYRLNILLLG